MSTCENEKCGKEFEPPPKNLRRRTCSRACACTVGWNKNRDQRLKSISDAQKARGGDIAEQNHIRWARPGERERLSQWNRERWTDPEVRAHLSQVIGDRQRTPEARKFYSDMRREMWKDPEYRTMVIARATASQRTQAYRARFSNILTERWKDPIWRQKYTDGIRRHVRSPEARKRQSVIKLKWWAESRLKLLTPQTQQPQLRQEIVRPPITVLPPVRPPLTTQPPTRGGFSMFDDVQEIAKRALQRRNPGGSLFSE